MTYRVSLAAIHRSFYRSCRLPLAVLLASGLVWTAAAQAQQIAVAEYDYATTPYETPIEVDVLANDSTEAPNSIVPSSLEILTPEVGGTFNVTASNTIEFTPDNGFYGIASVGYGFWDDALNFSNVGTLEIYVEEPVAPFAEDDYFETGFNEQTTLFVLLNDSGSQAAIDAGTVNITYQPIGNAAVQTDGTIIYTPEDGFEGIDYFEYEVLDERGIVSNTAFVTVYVELDAPPSLSLSAEKDPNGLWEISGHVYDDQDVTGLRVDFGLDAAGLYTYVDANGDYTMTVELGPLADYISATVSDGYKTSDEVTYYIGG